MLAIFLIILASSFVQGLTGFGFALVATPFLLHFLAPSELIFAYLTISLVLNSYLYFANKAPLIKKELLWLLFGGLFGLPLGFYLLQIISVPLLKHSTGILILVFLILIAIKKINLKSNQFLSLVIGFLIGTLQTSIGVNGPPLALYLHSLPHKQESIKRTISLIFFLLSLFSLIISLPIIRSYDQSLILGLISTPVVLLGGAIGHKLAPHLKQFHLKFIINLLIALSALSLIF